MDSTEVTTLSAIKDKEKKSQAVNGESQTENIAPRERLERCRVCQTEAALQRHYGGRSCIPCKAFFRRAVTTTKDYKLQKCRCVEVMNNNYKSFRLKQCPCCRFQSCRANSMKHELVLSGSQRALKHTTRPVVHTVQNLLVSTRQSKICSLNERTSKPTESISNLQSAHSSTSQEDEMEIDHQLDNMEPNRVYSPLNTIEEPEANQNNKEVSEDTEISNEDVGDPENTKEYPEAKENNVEELNNTEKDPKIPKSIEEYFEKLKNSDVKTGTVEISEEVQETPRHWTNSGALVHPRGAENNVLEPASNYELVQETSECVEKGYENSEVSVRLTEISQREQGTIEISELELEPFVNTSGDKVSPFLNYETLPKDFASEVSFGSRESPGTVNNYARSTRPSTICLHNCKVNIYSTPAKCLASESLAMQEMCVLAQQFRQSQLTATVKYWNELQNLMVDESPHEDQKNLLSDLNSRSRTVQPVPERHSRMKIFMKYCVHIILLFGKQNNEMKVVSETTRRQLLRRSSLAVILVIFSTAFDGTTFRWRFSEADLEELGMPLVNTATITLDKISALAYCDSHEVDILYEVCERLHKDGLSYEFKVLMICLLLYNVLSPDYRREEMKGGLVYMDLLFRYLRETQPEEAFDSVIHAYRLIQYVEDSSERLNIII